jgi:hypothetical protein
LRNKNILNIKKLEKYRNKNRKDKKKLVVLKRIFFKMMAKYENSKEKNKNRKKNV